jgi:hypothetical protein
MTRHWRDTSPALPFPGLRRFACARVLCLLFLLGWLQPLNAQVSKEYQIKAVFLWRLAQFVEWPTNAFASAQAPITIGVLGDNPFGEALDLAVRDETAHGRKLVVRQSDRIEDIRSCHLLYISRSEARRASAVTSALAGKPVLTVSDVDGFADLPNGMIQFVTVQSRVTFRINLEAAKAAGLVLDARLLRMAEVIKSQ